MEENLDKLAEHGLNSLFTIMLKLENVQMDDTERVEKVRKELYEVLKYQPNRSNWKLALMGKESLSELWESLFCYYGFTTFVQYFELVYVWGKEDFGWYIVK